MTACMWYLNLEGKTKPRRQLRPPTTEDSRDPGAQGEDIHFGSSERNGTSYSSIRTASSKNQHGQEFQYLSPSPKGGCEKGDSEKQHF